jgi:hypothetical protein
MVHSFKQVGELLRQASAFSSGRADVAANVLGNDPAPVAIALATQKVGERFWPARLKTLLCCTLQWREFSRTPIIGLLPCFEIQELCDPKQLFLCINYRHK